MSNAPAERLAAYIRKLLASGEFKIAETIEANYGHLGATLTDAVLQAGVNYETVVRPRVRRLIDECPQAGTTSGFDQLRSTPGLPQLLSRSKVNKTGAPDRKLGTLDALIELLLGEGVETEEQLRVWISEPGNADRLLAIHGVGPKTLNYLRILLGFQGVAVDRWLRRFLKEAGLEVSNDEEAHDLISAAAGLLGIQPAVLDHSIWRYMSSSEECDSQSPDSSM